MRRIVVAGIHTEVGKTVVAALLAEALGANYWKPVQCGLPQDRDWVRRFVSTECYPSSVCLKTPCSPHLAARLEGVQIQACKLTPPQHSGPLIIEGTGGLMAPLNARESWVDAAMHWDAEWLLVHRHYLGSLSHFLLTIEAMRRRNLRLWGIVFNGEGDTATEEMLLQQAESRCLGKLKWESSWTKRRFQEIARQWKQTLGV